MLKSEVSASWEDCRVRRGGGQNPVNMRRLGDITWTFCPEGIPEHVTNVVSLFNFFKTLITLIKVPTGT